MKETGHKINIETDAFSYLLSHTITDEPQQGTHIEMRRLQMHAHSLTKAKRLQAGKTRKQLTLCEDGGPLWRTRGHSVCRSALGRRLWWQCSTPGYMGVLRFRYRQHNQCNWRTLLSKHRRFQRSPFSADSVADWRSRLRDS